MAGHGHHWNSNRGKENHEEDQENKDDGDVEEEKKNEKEQSLLNEHIDGCSLPIVNNGSTYISNGGDEMLRKESESVQNTCIKPLRGSPYHNNGIPTNVTTSTVVQKLVSSLRYITSLKRARTESVKPLEEDPEQKKDGDISEDMITSYSCNTGAEVQSSDYEIDKIEGDSRQKTTDNLIDKRDNKTETENEFPEQLPLIHQGDEVRKKITASRSFRSKSAVKQKTHQRHEEKQVVTAEEIHIKKVELGSIEIDTTCPSTHADPLSQNSYVKGHLFACEFCLQFTDNSEYYLLHKAACTQKQPCGIEIYNKDDVSVFEIDGTKQKVYCENLCSLSKLFLDNKRKQCEVELFFFYVLTINNSTGKHLAGYFSKEKAPMGNNNVSCLLVLPHYQRRGLGRFLIDLSYLFSRIVKTPGTPERPLSKLGSISYQRYWKDAVVQFLYNHITEDSILIRSLSEDTGIDPYDIAVTLQALNMVKHHKNKVTIVVKHRALLECMESMQEKKHIVLDKMALKWTPWTQENGKEKDKQSRLLRKNSVHNFTVAKSEEQYFEATHMDEAITPPKKKAR